MTLCSGVYWTVDQENRGSPLSSWYDVILIADLLGHTLVDKTNQEKPDRKSKNSYIYRGSLIIQKILGIL
jgi:hypothetical protein